MPRLPGCSATRSRKRRAGARANCWSAAIPTAGRIHPLGGPSLPDDYSRALEGVAIGPDIGSCGSAAYYGKPVLATDIDTDPRWQPFKTRPLEVGLRAC